MVISGLIFQRINNMNITDLIVKTQKPSLYEKGSAVMWTDPYISGQLLKVHLNPEVDLASRKQNAIDSTVQWILEKIGKKKLKIRISASPC